MSKMDISVTVSKNFDKGTIKKEVSEMTRKEIAEMSRSLFSKLNKRITRLESAKGVISPALEAVNRSGGKFYMKGLNRNQLLKEYARAKTFENSATGTVTGARKHTKHLESIIGSRVKDKEYVSKMFETIHKVSELNPTIANMVGSKEVAMTVTEVVEDSIDLDLATQDEYERILNQNFDTIVDTLTEKYHELFQGLYDDLGSSFRM